jgi:hypothetical protein
MKYGKANIVTKQVSCIFCIPTIIIMMMTTTMMTLTTLRAMSAFRNKNKIKLRNNKFIMEIIMDVSGCLYKSVLDKLNN